MLGLRLDLLGTDELTWCDLRAIVVHCSIDSALRSHIAGLRDGVRVSHLLAQDVANTGRWSVYQRGGGKGRKPELLQLVRARQEGMWARTPDALTVEELDRRLGWDRSRP